MGWKDWELLNWRNLKPAGLTRESIVFTVGKRYRSEHCRVPRFELISAGKFKKLLI